ncbi:MAG TPA: hypothetical protein VN716_16655 [Vicinamibacterales bacterium]|nr:hypothetical protein [Vicinamibacterales bacterium]
MRRITILTSAACLVFAAYAASFLYFFVDDEAIPLVYARNLLRGRGFVYTALEGRVEGYSDFLHVLWSTLLLALTRAFGLSLLTPLLVGKAVSFAAAMALIAVTARTLRAQQVALPGVAAALAFLSLSGPLAVWACSSLEAVTFALVTTAFAAALMTRASRAAMLLGAAAILLRIDGPIYVGAIGFAIAVAIPETRVSARRAVLPIAVVAVIYHAWRLWYFRAILSAPLAAKVLFRVAGPSHAVVKADVPYLLGYARIYGIASIVVAVAALAAAWRHGAGRACAIALVILGLYVQVVGDWMFGWRFLVALLPLAAVVLGCAVARLPPRLAWVAALIVTAWSAAGAQRFAAAFVDAERKPLFYAQPAGGEAIWLGRYYELIDASRRFMHAGDRVADNQAGLLPYLLDLENIDDLGICSRFIAELPTTDVYYTAVGRYSPLTDQPVLRTAQAYLLHQDVQFLVSPTDLLFKANHDSIPRSLLGGLFERVALDASGANAIYRRTATPADQFRSDPSAFTENLVHTTRLLRASVDGRGVPPDRFGADLPFLREQAATQSVAGNMEIDLSFARHDEDVSAFFIGQLTSQLPADMTVLVNDESGRQTAKLSIAIPAGASSVYRAFPAGVRGRALAVRVAVASGEDRLTIADMRLEGQTPALHDYVRTRLRFVRGDAPGTR